MKRQHFKLPDDMGEIVEALKRLRGRGKTSIMMIVAEGDENGGAVAINEQLKAAGNPFSTRVAILGHLQRGGTPTPADRILGIQLGHAAVIGIEQGHTKVMAGRVGDKIVYTPFEETFGQHKAIPAEFLELIATLSH